MPTVKSQSFSKATDHAFPHGAMMAANLEELIVRPLARLATRFVAERERRAQHAALQQGSHH